MDPYAYISELLVKRYGVKPEVIAPDATLSELGLDSLSVAELVFDVGDKYDIDIPDERAQFSTLAEAAVVVGEIIKEKNG